MSSGTTLNRLLSPLRRSPDRDLWGNGRARVTTLTDACEASLADARARRLREGTLVRYRLTLRQLCEYATSRGVSNLADVDRTLLRHWRQSWLCRPSTESLHIQITKTFFRFAVTEQWIEATPASGLRLSGRSGPNCRSDSRIPAGRDRRPRSRTRPSLARRPCCQPSRLATADLHFPALTSVSFKRLSPQAARPTPRKQSRQGEASWLRRSHSTVHTSPYTAVRTVSLCSNMKVRQTQLGEVGVR